MDIIIVGCGKVGFTLVEQLSNEDHNIVVIDEKPEKVQYITDRLDVMGIVGNGINHKTLLGRHRHCRSFNRSYRR